MPCGDVFKMQSQQYITVRDRGVWPRSQNENSTWQQNSLCGDKCDAHAVSSRDGRAALFFGWEDNISGEKLQTRSIDYLAPYFEIYLYGRVIFPMKGSGVGTATYAVVCVSPALPSPIYHSSL